MLMIILVTTDKFLQADLLSATGGWIGPITSEKGLHITEGVSIRLNRVDEELECSTIKVQSRVSALNCDPTLYLNT